ncbi:MAG: hypothetical protein LBL39_05635 [Planctomycetaceae bacterium]|nr:hypothetical protein [Planctomycetaceae bacterium]
MDNPVQTECSTGLGNLLNRNYVVVQQRRFILAVSVLNYHLITHEMESNDFVEGLSTACKILFALA